LRLSMRHGGVAPLLRGARYGLSSSPLESARRLARLALDRRAKLPNDSPGRASVTTGSGCATRCGRLARVPPLVRPSFLRPLDKTEVLGAALGGTRALTTTSRPTNGVPRFPLVAGTSLYGAAPESNRAGDGLRRLTGSRLLSGVELGLHCCVESGRLWSGGPCRVWGTR
jgi:hypothetical protein